MRGEVTVATVLAIILSAAIGKAIASTTAGAAVSLYGLVERMGREWGEWPSGDAERHRFDGYRMYPRARKNPISFI
jgi:hypothetical protein